MVDSHEECVTQNEHNNELLEALALTEPFYFITHAYHAFWFLEIAASALLFLKLLISLRRSSSTS